MMNDATLELNNISYSQNSAELLNNINFSLKKGHVKGLLGINGAGKSTTLKIIAGILHPDTGERVVRLNKKIGYIPEIPPLIPSWKVCYFLQYACILHSIPLSQQKLAIKRIIELCHLQTILNKPCHALSKGNKQRVAIAQALIHQPDILVLDEPTSGLDPQQIEQFRRIIMTIKPDTAIIFSSHIMQEVTSLCDTAIIIHNGKQVGELDLSNHSSQILIEFSKKIPSSFFTTYAPWQSGEDYRHYFILNQDYNKNDILAFCIGNELPIQSVSGADSSAEYEFLSLIGHQQQEKHA